ncbi:Inhibitor of the KinA pathway to sporulation, predicted exonuclease [Lachnospiraceae bacterium]|nr:Inhibitor of the KinA pathway to sporulation, predicted exonuclease [Lachnospiraceae bacterium]
MSNKRNYIVLDLEWNQGADSSEHPEIPFEIVEIGAVKLNDKKEIVDTFMSYVKPQVYLKMHFMTQKVIHLTMDELKDAEVFPVVWEKFLKWCGEDYIFCTWGTLDLTELQYNIRYHKLPDLSDGPIPYLDVQKLFSLDKEDGKSRRALEYAVDFMKLEKDDSFHRADSDALYTAEILARLSKAVESRISFDLFHLPADRKREVLIHFDTYSKYISRRFPDKAAALRDANAASLRCYICERNTKKKIGWFTLNNKHYLGLGSCAEHGLMHGKLRIKKTDDGGVYVVKTIRRATKEDENGLKTREKKARLQASKLAKMLRNQTYRTRKNNDVPS